MTPAYTTLSQDILKDQPPSILVRHLELNALTPAILEAFLATEPARYVGLAGQYGTKCRLSALALAVAGHVLVVRLGAGDAKGEKKGRHPARALVENTLCRPSCKQLSFDMDRLAAALYADHYIRVAGGVDVQAMAAPTKGRASIDAVKTSLGGESAVNSKAVSRLFRDKACSKEDDLALRAWAAFQAGARFPELVQVAAVIDTASFDVKSLQTLCKIIRDADRRDAMKSTKTKNDITAEVTNKGTELELTCTRFSTKIRLSASQTIRIDTHAGGKPVSISGRAKKVNGRAATITLAAKAAVSTIKAVYTIGKAEATCAEDQRTLVVLEALQRTNTFLSQPFPAQIWGHPPASKPRNLKAGKALGPVPVHIRLPQRPLNPSQMCAVERALDPTETISVIHGPPGSGKTTCIAGMVTSIMHGADKSRTIWLAAQSNVAVKNIAEKLDAIEFLDFRLIVSKDFHFDWHEHLYERIVPNIIRSDTLEADLVDVERQLGGARVILCTLSMLTSPRISDIVLLVPVQTVVLDEASQIELGDYVPFLSIHRATLQKLVCIGDDKQLPPYGAEQIEELTSIFEVKHLRKRAVFLDTQYRMPVPIGAFISKYVYGGKLRSDHKIASFACCKLIDVADGVEKKDGTSWRNEREIEVILKLVPVFVAAKKKFRIITPYEPQRSSIEEALQEKDLPWKDKVFNVDSFQGNEEDIIIISVVRTSKTGFLSNLRRTNVMLSRCKESMFIVTNRTFLSGPAKKTLVGKLAAEWGPTAWISGKTIISGREEGFEPAAGGGGGAGTWVDVLTLGMCIIVCCTLARALLGS